MRVISQEEHLHGVRSNESLPWKRERADRNVIGKKRVALAGESRSREDRN
jgi:hypothetical protein